MLRRLLREPLLHFLLLGGVLFAVFGRGGPQGDAADRRIVVSAADIDRLAAGFAQTWHRPPAADELEAQIRDHVREEVLYRTALTLGLDKDDTIVRRRLRQKMEFLIEDTVPEPQEAELQAYFHAHEDKFRTEPQISFRQVFVSAGRGDAAEADARETLVRLAAAGPGAADEGDPLLARGGLQPDAAQPGRRPVRRRLRRRAGAGRAGTLGRPAEVRLRLPPRHGHRRGAGRAAAVRAGARGGGARVVRRAPRRGAGRPVPGPARRLPGGRAGAGGDAVRRIALRLGLLVALLLPAQGLRAHEVRPGFLELRETAAGVFLMTWKVPALGEFRLAMRPRLPETCRFLAEPATVQAGGAFIEHGEVRCEQGLAGREIAVEGLDATLTDVLVRVETADGGVRSARLTPAAPAFTVPARPDPAMVLRTYVGLGVEHILSGTDHLLFVLCLLLLVRDVRKLLATVTAFTLAHSVTLAAATLGFVRVPTAPVEATIALSIVFLAGELVRGEAGRSAVTSTYPWLVAFSFGLLHGLGFAGALAEVGLPQGEIPLALLAFNVGVELGQLAFIAAVLSLARLARLLPLRWPGWAPGVVGYAIGSVAAFWVIDRLAAAA